MKNVEKWRAFSFRKTTGGPYKIKIYWKNSFKLGAIFLIMGWILIASGLFLNFRLKKDYDEVSFLKMLILPFRFGEHRVEVGEYHIQKGFELLERGEYLKGIELLRLGVIRSPKNLKARRELGFIFRHGLKRYDLAKKILVDGLPYACDELDYFQQTINLIYQEKDFELIDKLCKEHIGHTSPEIRSFLVNSLAAVYNSLGRHEETLTLDREYNLKNSFNGLYLLAQALWARDLRLEAIRVMEENLGWVEDKQIILGQLAYFCQKAGMDEKALGYARRRIDEASGAVDAQVDYLHILYLTGQGSLASARGLRMIDCYRDDYEGLVQFSKFAVVARDVELARKAYEIGIERGFDVGVLALAYVNTLAFSYRYQDAHEMLVGFEKERCKWLSAYHNQYNACRGFVEFGLGREELSHYYLDSALEIFDIKSLYYLRSIADELMRKNGELFAYKISSALYNKDPSFLDMHISLQLKLVKIEGLVENIAKYAISINPQKEILEAAYERIRQDDFLLEEKTREALDKIRVALGGGGQLPRDYSCCGHL